MCVQVVLAGANGVSRLVEISASPLIVENKPCGAVAVWNDVTERRSAEQSLRASESLLRSFYDNVPVMMGVAEMKGDEFVHIFDNKTAARLLDRSGAVFAGKSVSELDVSSDYAATWQRSYRLAAETKSPVRFVLSRGKGEAATILSATVAPIEDQEGPNPRFCYVAVDVTESERSRRSIERLNATLTARAAELEAANQELEAFTYSVSHDLRAPLRGIEGYSRMMVEDYGDRLDATALHYLDVISKSTTEMAQLIDDLLSLSRLGRQHMSAAKVDLAELARVSFEEITKAPGNRSVEIDIKALPAARGDRSLLRQVLRNLLSNAFKFTRTREHAHIEVGGRREGRENVYWVRDNGVGFDMAFANKLFGVFQRLHSAREFEGTGVGLAIVQRIVGRHGGRVWADGLVDVGATFYFALESGDSE